MTNPGTAIATENKKATSELRSAAATSESVKRESDHARSSTRSISVQDSSYHPRNLKRGLSHTLHQYSWAEYASSPPRDDDLRCGAVSPGNWVAGGDRKWRESMDRRVHVRGECSSPSLA